MPSGDLILHIGMPKTGSTSVQRLLAQNQPMLRENGFYSPREPVPNHSYSFAAMFAHSPPLGNKAYRDRDYWVDQARRAGSRTFVVSAERLFGFGTEELDDLHRFATSNFRSTKVLCYIRHPVPYVRSRWLQLMKNPRPGRSKEEHFQLAVNLYKPRRLRTWIERFGRANVSARVFDRGVLHGGDVVVDFLEQIGFSGPTPSLPAVSNKSLGAHSAALLYDVAERYPRYVDEEANPRRGLAHRLDHFLAILGRVDDCVWEGAPFDVAEANALNSEIDWLKSTFGADFDFTSVTASSTGERKFPEMADVPSDFVVDLVNEFNREIERLRAELRDRRA